MRREDGGASIRWHYSGPCKALVPKRFEPQRHRGTERRRGEQTNSGSFALSLSSLCLCASVVQTALSFDFLLRQPVLLLVVRPVEQLRRFESLVPPVAGHLLDL